MAQERFEFQTEAKRMLNMMINSVYSNSDIFLRELISNASDALDKLRFESLTKKDLAQYTNNPQIRISTDPERKIVSISDNGIGMDREDLIKFLGTIAKSGTEEFLKALGKSKTADSSLELIGQFGVGFYSSFMVADRVMVVTRKAGDEQGWIFESDGDGSYTITEGVSEVGTTVTLYLKAPEKPEGDEEAPATDYTSNWTLRTIIKKYSDFVSYPIVMKSEKRIPKIDADGKEIDGEFEILLEDETINSMKAIWTRPESDVTDEEYNEFYKHISHDWSEPTQKIIYHAEGSTEFKALLFVPSSAPFDLNYRDSEQGINLFIRRVFIMKDCKELIPEYLRFVRGVVDSEDLNLNISREILQQSREIKLIHNSLTRKLLSTFKANLTDDREKYTTFWTNFGKVLKEGLYTDPKNKEDVLATCLFNTTHESKLCSIAEYIERMKEGQDSIYYISGKNLAAVEKSPHIEAFKAKGYEVLLLIDPVDELWPGMFFEYKGKKFKSIIKGDVDLDAKEEEKPEEKEAKEKEKQEFTPFLEAIKATLDEHIKEVKISNRLTESPACVITADHDMTPQLEQLLRSAGQEPPKVKRILELNPKHKIFQRLNEIYSENDKDERIAKYSFLLFGQAVLAEGGNLPDPAQFSMALAQFMSESI